MCRNLMTVCEKHETEYMDKSLALHEAKIILPNLKKRRRRKEEAKTKEQQILEEGLHILADIFKREKAESKASQTEFV